MIFRFQIKQRLRMSFLEFIGLKAFQSGTVWMGRNMRYSVNNFPPTESSTHYPDHFYSALKKVRIIGNTEPSMLIFGKYSSIILSELISVLNPNDSQCV